MAGHPDLIRKCTVGKQSTDVHTANLNQAVVDQFIRRNLLPDHISRICSNYSEKMNAMLQKLSEFPAGVHCTSPEGGLFIWVELPEKMNAQELLTTAIDNKVAFVPGTHFCVDGGHENTLRLNFSNSSLEQIESGMNTLNTLTRKHMNE
jgi:2-aminoadipate transaminase